MNAGLEFAYLRDSLIQIVMRFGMFDQIPNGVVMDPLVEFGMTCERCSLHAPYTRVCTTEYREPKAGLDVACMSLDRGMCLTTECFDSDKNNTAELVEQDPWGQRNFGWIKIGTCDMAKGMGGRSTEGTISYDYSPLG